MGQEHLGTCNAYINEGGCHDVGSLEECFELCDADSNCKMAEYPTDDNERYADQKICCLEYCDLDTCGALDTDGTCGSDGPWDSYTKGPELYSMSHTSCGGVAQDLNKNLGEYRSPEECAVDVQADPECDQNVFMWSNNYTSWGCRCCKSRLLYGDRPWHLHWNVYSIAAQELTAYSDNTCGPYGEDANWGRCGKTALNAPPHGCVEDILVSRDVCDGEHASLFDIRGNGSEASYNDGECDYWYFAIWQCVEPIPLQQELTAYWDKNTCGPFGEDANWNRCGANSFDGCVDSQEIQVSTTHCATGSAVLFETKGNGTSGSYVDAYGCEYSYFATWHCKEPEKIISHASCGQQVKNLGPFESANDCALVVQNDAECISNVFMWSEHYHSWDCRCCVSDENPTQHDLWNLYHIPAPTVPPTDHYVAKGSGISTRKCTQGLKDVLTEQVTDWPVDDSNCDSKLVSDDEKYPIVCCSEYDIRDDHPFMVSPQANQHETPSCVASAHFNLTDKPTNNTADYVIYQLKNGGAYMLPGTKPIQEGCMLGTWSEAEAQCASVGGRLCTRDELMSNCADQTGCWYDQRLVWTSASSSDSPGYTIELLRHILPKNGDRHHLHIREIKAFDSGEECQLYFHDASPLVKRGKEWCCPDENDVPQCECFRTTPDRAIDGDLTTMILGEVYHMVKKIIGCSLKRFVYLILSKSGTATMGGGWQTGRQVLC